MKLSRSLLRFLVVIFLIIATIADSSEEEKKEVQEEVINENIATVAFSSTINKVCLKGFRYQAGKCRKIISPQTSTPKEP